MAAQASRRDWRWQRPSSTNRPERDSNTLVGGARCCHEGPARVPQAQPRREGRRCAFCAHLPRRPARPHRLSSAARSAYHPHDDDRRRWAPTAPQTRETDGQCEGTEGSRGACRFPRRPCGARRDRAPGALALDADRPPRQQRPPEHRESQRSAATRPRRPRSSRSSPRSTSTSCAPATAFRSSRTPRRPSTPPSTCSAVSIERYLTTLREFGGLQAYPSRTKDPDPVDFSTGSVGLGAVAPVFAALAHRYGAAPLRPRHLQSLRLPDRRRRAGRRQRLGDGRRRGHPRSGQRDLDRRPQPPEPRPGHPRRPRRPSESALRRRRLARLRGQVRHPPRGGDGRPPTAPPSASGSTR